MLNRFRIHGDNIVECERIVKLILYEIQTNFINVSIVSSSILVYTIQAKYYSYNICWQLELLPGFNKSGRNRWKSDIFTILNNNGSFLDETPDVVVTYIKNGIETILFAIEFCSALQAGNQAWQRSGRAFSTGRTGCPYLYIVDFVKYELDSNTRARKALRFPNPAVPYSYINFSKKIHNFVAQVYIRSEEFNKNNDPSLKNFDEKNFAEKELSQYIVKRMCGMDTYKEEEIILQKNLNIVKFLASNSNSSINFTPMQWDQLYANQDNIIKFSLKNSVFNFHKTITAKGQHGKSQNFINIIDKLSVGLTSRDLPFGIIPSNKRKEFAYKIKELYPTYDTNVINNIASDKLDLIICIIKGFKPRGDDNRPDRGILPFAVMLSSTNIEIMTYIYGPIIEKNFNLLLKNYKVLSNVNGFWKSILSLSNYIALDAPVLSKQPFDVKLLLDTSSVKNYYTKLLPQKKELTQAEFPNELQSFHEDDVDTGIHFIFSHLLCKVCFEGMCNPPGGDWSGLSIIYQNQEFRWLSLPRVSENINGKRPDHVLELFTVLDRPILLSIESKEQPSSLEPNVGIGLINYIHNLMMYIPNVERIIYPHIGQWKQSKTSINYHNFEIISAVAYLRCYSKSHDNIFSKCKCDMIFMMNPINNGWEIEIITNSKNAEILKKFICNNVISNNIIIS